MHKISYTGDGQTTEFQFAFPFFQNADIHVSLDNVSQDADTYTVYPNSDLSGGMVRILPAPATNVNIDIYRRVSLSRVIDYQPTAKIDPESLNADFNFLLAAFQDINATNIDLAEWDNIHNNVTNFLQYTLDIIEDKLNGGAVLGLYNNLLGVLNNALPQLINDYGSITEPATNENRDDYGVL